MTIKVWSDCHFNHGGILKYCAATRPYANVDEMNAGLIERWNSTVATQDTIYLLGDFGFERGADLREIFAVLNGHKHLVRGNHDEKNKTVLGLAWESIQDLVTLRENGVRAVACHYPMETWKSAHKDYLMLHGHSHGTLRRVVPHRFDVGVDVFRAPVSLRELAVIAAGQQFVSVDHHTKDL